MVARNPNASETTLEELSRDDNDYVRRAIIDNFNVTPKILKELSKDENWMIKQAAEYALKNC